MIVENICCQGSILGYKLYFRSNVQPVKNRYRLVYISTHTSHEEHDYAIQRGAKLVIKDDFIPLGELLE